MEKDKFSKAIKSAFPNLEDVSQETKDFLIARYPGLQLDRDIQNKIDMCAEPIEAKLVELYPRLQSDKELRNEFAKHIESENPITTQNNIALLTKLGSAMKYLEEKQTFPDFRYNRYTVVQNFFEQIKSYAKVHSEEMNKLLAVEEKINTQKGYYEASHYRTDFDSECSQLTTAITTQDYVYIYAESLYTNDSFLDTQPIDEQIKSMTNCATNDASQTKEFIEKLNEDSEITIRSSLLLGKVYPKFRQKDAKGQSDIQKLSQLSKDLPRYVFAACLDMIQNGEMLENPQMLEERMNEENVAFAGLTLTKEQCDAMLKNMMTKTAANSKATIKITKEEQGRT